MNDRQSGRTTRQMHAAPRGAIYIWCNVYTHYARSLADALGRFDLVIVPPSNCRYPYARQIVIDHAASVCEEMQTYIDSTNKHLTNKLESKP